MRYDHLTPVWSRAGVMTAEPRVVTLLAGDGTSLVGAPPVEVEGEPPRARALHGSGGRDAAVPRDLYRGSLKVCRLWRTR
jgi:hypothetical protein